MPGTITRKKSAQKKAAKKKTQALRRVAEPRIDEPLVERSLALIEAHVIERDASRRAIGEHILDAYFGGDSSLARSKNPQKPKSFTALATRAEAQFGWDESDFRYAVRIAITYRDLPSAVRDQIPASSLAALASIQDITEMRRLAARIASGEIRGEAAREAIAEAGASEARGGRPRIPPALRAGQRAIRAVLRLEDDADMSAGRMRELDEMDALELADQMDDAAKRLREVAEALRERQ
jgi:hypothetical protein